MFEKIANPRQENTVDVHEREAIDVQRDVFVQDLEYNLDIGPESVEDLEYPKRLLTACHVFEISHIAKQKLYDYIYDPKYREVAVSNLFHAVHYTEVDGLLDGVVLRDVLRNTFNYLHDDSLDQSHEASLYEATRILDQFFTELRLIDSLGDDVNDDVNYLALKYFQGFAEEFGADVENPMFDKVHVSAHIDHDSYIPFVIQPNQFAVFDQENAELYVLDSKQSDEIAYGMAEPMSRLGYQVTEIEMGTFSTPLIPRDLYAYSEYIRRVGTPIGKLIPTQDAKEIAAYRVIQKTHFKEILESEFGISIEELSIQEQYYFLNYLNRKSVKKVRFVRDFTKEYGVQGMRTFLSLQQYGDDMGDKIVGFSNAHESAGEVFASYGALLDEVESFEDFVRHELVCDQENCKEIIKKARERLLFDANSYLANSVSSNNPDTVVEVLNQKKVEAKALSAAIMTYMSTVGSSIEDFNSFHKNTYDNNIEPQLLDELKNIYTQNYQNIGYDKEAIDSLVENLEKKIYSADTKIKTWEFGNDKILAFTAVTENQQDKSAYISGLNVNPDLKTAKAAKSLLEETISEYSEKGFVIKAEATAGNFQGYGEMDWVATSLKDDDLGQENFLFDIAIYPTQKFFSKSLTQKEIKEMVLDTDEYIGSNEIMVVKNPDMISLTNMLGKGYAITRYFKTRKIKDAGQKEEIFVLEKIDEAMNYSTATQTQNVA